MTPGFSMNCAKDGVNGNGRHGICKVSANRTLLGIMALAIGNTVRGS